MRKKVKIMIYELAIAKKSDLWYINSQLQDKKYLREKKSELRGKMTDFLDLNSQLWEKKSQNYEI